MSDDSELEALRAKRLAELQQKYGNQQGGQNQSQEGNDKKAKEDELRNSILSQVLSQEARSRLSTLSVAKPEKAKLVENLLINNARMGIIRGKLSESDLIDLLEKVSQQTTKQTTVKFDRRRTALDDSDED